MAAIASNRAHPTHPGMEDQGGLLAELANGGAAVINFDYLRPWGRMQRPWGDDRLTTPDATEMLPLEPACNIIADFAASLEGDSEAAITTEESFRMTEVALKARDAQDTGGFVEL